MSSCILCTGIFRGKQRCWQCSRAIHTKHMRVHTLHQRTNIYRCSYYSYQWMGQCHVWSSEYAVFPNCTFQRGIWLCRNCFVRQLGTGALRSCWIGRISPELGLSGQMGTLVQVVRTASYTASIRSWLLFWNEWSWKLYMHYCTMAAVFIHICGCACPQL